MFIKMQKEVGKVGVRGIETMVDGLGFVGGGEENAALSKSEVF